MSAASRGEYIRDTYRAFWLTLSRVSPTAAALSLRFESCEEREVAICLSDCPYGVGLRILSFFLFFLFFLFFSVFVWLLC